MTALCAPFGSYVESSVQVKSNLTGEKTKMKSKLLFVGILAAAPAAFGQSPETSRKEDGIFYMAVPPPGPGDHTFEFISSEFRFEGNAVKNAPYSAQALTEMTQRLADGNRISH